MRHPLEDVNLSELIQMARSAGVGNLGRNLSRTEIIRMLDEGLPAGLSLGHVAAECPLDVKRRRMEAHIQRHFRSLRTQLPCKSGKCVGHGCPDVIVHRCWGGFEEDML